MKVRELVGMLNKKENLGLEILVSSDEELNTLFGKWEVCSVANNKLVIYGLSGTEVDL